MIRMLLRLMVLIAILAEPRMFLLLLVIRLMVSVFILRLLLVAVVAILAVA